MPILNNSIVPASAGGYEIDNSLRFNDDDSAYLSRTPSSAGNRKTWTWSGWVKRGNLTTTQALFGTYTDTNNRMYLFYSSTADEIGVFDKTGGTIVINTATSASFRDTSAWYHVVLAVDSTQATSTDRVKLYVNSELQTMAYYTAPSLNADGQINSTISHKIGNQNANYLDGYLAEVNFVDGQALTPSDFGETGTYGEWKPIEYTGTYGTNGFYLPFNHDTTVDGMGVVTYNGDGSTQSIMGVGFQPDLVWIKNRNAAINHHLYDGIRGATKTLAANASAAEETKSGLTAFDSDGFTVGSWVGTNKTSDSHVAWCWDMGGSNATNNNGSIQSTVRANSAYGQSIVSWVGTGSTSTVGHGLSSAPEMVIVKSRDSGYNWGVGLFHLNNTKMYDLNFTGTGDTDNYWGNTNPTNSVFTVGTKPVTNASGNNYITYCFHSVAGYSKIGSYTGNGSTSGPSVTCGFKPRFLLIKATTSAEHWFIFDTERDPGNPVDKNLVVSSNGAENSNYNIDFTSTGFQPVSTLTEINGNGTTYTFMAFADTREALLWADGSGNNNDWTPNNLAATDQMLDTPTNNFATMNPLSGGGVSLEEGNLKLSQQNKLATSTIQPTSGKWYWEVEPNNRYAGSPYFGMLTDDPEATWTNVSNGQGMWIASYTGDPNFLLSSEGTVNGSLGPWPHEYHWSFAYDADTGNMWVAKDGSWTSVLSGADPSTGANPHISGLTTGKCIPAFGDAGWSHPDYYLQVNFGADATYAGKFSPSTVYTDGNGYGEFFYEPPTGFNALCTANLPDPAVIPSEHFNVVEYVGNDSTNAITGVGFQPDLVWTKVRNRSENHALLDSVRGTNKMLHSNGTQTEYTASTSFNSFDSDGFTLGNDAETNAVNNNSDSLVAWNWNCPTTFSGNTDGTITSSGRKNTDAGFSIVSYTGTGSNATVGHGLSSAPNLVIVKRLAGTHGWFTQSSELATDGVLRLDTTGAVDSSSSIFNNAYPTPTVFSLGNGGSNVNANDYIAYCFHSVDGYSKVGSYTGNGSSDGPFVYCGFRPKYVMFKLTTLTGESWLIKDSERAPYNPADPYLYANLNSAEASSNSIRYLDFVSNGFKLRGISDELNKSGHTYIYLAFAEVPFKFSNGR